MRSRDATEAALVALAATALTIVLTYPVAFQFDHVGRLATDDGRWSIWVVSWVAHALTTDPLRVFHANIFYPHPYTLAFSEANLVAGAIAAPVWLATKNPYAAHNFVFLVAFVTACTGAYYLARHLTRSRPAAVVAAVLFGFCPFIFARTAHVQLLFIGGLPFSMLAFHRLADRPTLSRAISLGLTLWATALACAYYGIFAALMVALGTVVFASSRGLWRSRDYWIALSLAALTSISLTLPFFLPYVYLRRNSGFARTLDDARQYSANLEAWAASSAWAHRWWLSALGEFNEVLFPGILLLLLGSFGGWVMLRRRRDVAALYLLIATLAFWLSFGPDAGLYTVFYEVLPVFSFLRAPGRMGIMVTLALSVFAAAAVAELLSRTRRPTALGLTIACLGIAELVAMPLTQFRRAEPTAGAYRLLANLPRGPVAELPYWHERSDFPRHAYYMLNSTAHWQPLINGYSDYIPPDFRRSVLPLSTFPSRASFAILASVGARYVVLHLDMYDARLRARLLQGLDTYAAYLRPLSQEGSVWLFEIVAFPN